LTGLQLGIRVHIIVNNVSLFLEESYTKRTRLDPEKRQKKKRKDKKSLITGEEYMKMIEQNWLMWLNPYWEQRSFSSFSYSAIHGWPATLGHFGPYRALLKHIWTYPCGFGHGLP